MSSLNSASSSTDVYVYDLSTIPEHVLLAPVKVASYGSNLDSSKLSAYFAGGQRRPGMPLLPKSPFGTPSQFAVASRIPFEVYFGEGAIGWQYTDRSTGETINGGRALLDIVHLSRADTERRGAYVAISKMIFAQFLHLLLGENILDEHPPLQPDVVQSLLDGDVFNAPVGTLINTPYSVSYRGVIVVDKDERGVPVLTFTNPDGKEGVLGNLTQRNNPPSPEYLKTIASGLIVSRPDMSAADITTYLADLANSQPVDVVSKAVQSAWAAIHN